MGSKTLEDELSELDDSRLVFLAQPSQSQRNIDLGELYERYVEKIYSYMFYRTGNREDAEDLTSKVFLKAVESIVKGKYNERNNFMGWLYTIAHNLLANYYRDTSRERKGLLRYSQSGQIARDLEETVFDNVVNEKIKEILLEVIRTLPDDRQLLLHLKYTLCLKNREIARIMGRTEGAIKSLYHRTLVELREKLSEIGVLD